MVTYIETAIERLHQFEPPEGYWLAFSGGKDSICIYHLAKMAEVKFDAHYAVTTIDPPEIPPFIRKYYPAVRFEHPERPFLRLLVEKGFPLRQRRWCCERYKERGGAGRRLILGVRWAESNARSKRKMFEHCFKGGLRGGGKTYVNPIIDWSDRQVWNFIHDNGFAYPNLYNKGWRRIGCLMCPLAAPKERERESCIYPRYTAAFITAFERLHASGRDSMKRWSSGREMFYWWLGVCDPELQQELFS